MALKTKDVATTCSHLPQPDVAFWGDIQLLQPSVLSNSFFMKAAMSFSMLYLRVRRSALDGAKGAHQLRKALLQCLGRAVNGILLHVFGHVSILDDGLDWFERQFPAPICSV